jgi:hypothetical protein
MRTRFATAVTLAFFAGALGIACSDDLGTGGDNAGGDFNIAVSSGTQPQYSWGAGPALSIAVYRASNTNLAVWSVANPTQQNIGSPVQHGTVPAGALVLADEETTLSAGVRYRVEIRLANGQQDAFREFTP